MNRVDQTYALLRSMADWEPSLTTWTGSVVRTAGAQGETAGHRQPCPHCDGTGKAPGRMRDCRFCKGAGVQWIDPQTGRVVNPPASDEPFTGRDYEQGIRWRRVRCDRCGGDGCDRCAQTGKTDVLDSRQTDRSLRQLEQQWPHLRAPGDPDDAPGWWLSAALERKQAQWAKGSYPQLERLLQRLQVEYPVRYRLIDRHLIHPHDGLVMSDRVQITIDEIVHELAERMPHTIVVPEQAVRWGERCRQSLWRGQTTAHDDARLERDEEIRSLASKGCTPNDLAATHGLTERQIRRIIRADVATATAA